MIIHAMAYADADHDRPREPGTQVVMELTGTDYASRDYAARDPEDHVWNSGAYRPSRS